MFTFIIGIAPTALSLPADPSRASVALGGSASHESGDLARITWTRVAVSGHRVLLIGHGLAVAAEHLRVRNAASLDVVELDPACAEACADGPGTIRVSAEGANGVDFADGSFDVVVACDLLERVRRPARFSRS